MWHLLDLHTCDSTLASARMRWSWSFATASSASWRACSSRHCVVACQDHSRRMGEWQGGCGSCCSWVPMYMYTDVCASIQVRFTPEHLELGRCHATDPIQPAAQIAAARGAPVRGLGQRRDPPLAPGSRELAAQMPAATYIRSSTYT